MEEVHEKVNNVLSFWYIFWGVTPLIAGLQDRINVGLEFHSISICSSTVILLGFLMDDSSVLFSLTLICNQYR